MIIGLFGIGLDTYWDQFEGLLERLNGYQLQIFSKLEQSGSKILNAGMVDNPEKAKDCASLFAAEEVDLMVLYISTYALSHNVLPIVQKIKVPILVLNLQPVPAINYEKFNALGDRGIMTGEWLAHCQACVTPELASVFKRAGIDFNLITGYLDEELVWKEISEWLQAMNVIKVMSENRAGILGNYYNGMLDVYSDLTQQAIVFRNHFELIEFGNLKALIEKVSNEEVGKKIEQFHEEFEVSDGCSEIEMDRAACTSVALDKLINEFNLGSLAYYYEGTGDSDYENIVTSLIPGLTLLTGHNIPVAGECEVKNVQAMKIMDILGVGGSFSEFYAMDFNDDIVMLGHDGPAHFKIAEGKVGLVPVPVYHGKPGQGLSIQMKVMNGPVTLLSVCQTVDGSIKLLCAEGESVEGPTLQIGNTNSRYRFSISARDFINKWSMAGPSHHCAIGVGHVAGIIQKIASLYKIECEQIC